ncbi:MAG: hypothetical protein K0S66_2359 [Sphingomonas sp.]|jgi:hypothetical protein|nr:hypothetical protein [Sphingomonas sp.]
MMTALDLPPDTLDEAERSFCDTIRQHGWLRTAALAEEGKPGFSFTTGFGVTAQQPELVIFSTADDVVHDIFWALYRRASSGLAMPVGRRTAEVFSNLPAYLFPVAPRNFAAYLGWSRWFYRGDGFSCLQIVWPDRSGVFPWEDGFDRTFASDQVDLTEMGWAAHRAD